MSLSENLKDFVKKCLVVEPSQRMNVDQMLSHSFLNGSRIPEKLPNSTLVCPPTAQFAKQYQTSCDAKQKLESTAPINLMMSTRGPIGAKLENSNELVLQSARDNAQLMETRDKTGTSPMSINRNLCSSNLTAQQNNNFLSHRSTTSPQFQSLKTMQAPKQSQHHYGYSNMALEARHKSPAQQQNYVGTSLTNRHSDKKSFPLQYGMEKENSQKRLETSPKYLKHSPTSVQKEPFA